ncbi:MAG: alanine dehydrogenase [Deltaproteobacteria bacterium]|nr:alanine dehydrogenase [Deltaproteobacteria bacterium]MBW2048260.1 alanine dehydrogenase [Deltaproteobacteria bacterium]MBW2110010.1 alanine dehydrogenase [Deltaproteobacteria bacterium]MBW2351789.1 alanine dehydrogenase [Deltaproteobacteria bacterium]HDZ90411.1 alanine dehydrogenase [Deltaproteobacteria bacterium]
MIIGVPTEVKVAERRVAVTPSGVRTLVRAGHRVLIQSGAGTGSGFSDESYVLAGAEMRPDPTAVWSDSEMILKVKEPLPQEYDLMREDQIIFTYLHLAANRELALKLAEKRVVAIAYETIQTDRGALPLLAPMSAVAGRLSIQAGAYCLEARTGGMGILLSGVPGVRPAYVVIIGAGVAGLHACFGAAGNDARVTILDINQERMDYIHDVMRGSVTILMSNEGTLEEEVVKADLVISSVLIPGAAAPKLITRSLLRKMKPGAAIVDIAIDQGGCCETSRPTTHEAPTYVEEGIVHYCVNNMPGAVPRTSTMALTNATLPYALEIATSGYKRAMRKNPAILKGMNIIKGNVVYKAVADSVGLPCVPLE